MKMVGTVVSNTSLLIGPQQPASVLPIYGELTHLSGLDHALVARNKLDWFPPKTQHDTDLEEDTRVVAVPALSPPVAKLLSTVFTFSSDPDPICNLNAAVGLGSTDRVSVTFNPLLPYWASAKRIEHRLDYIANSLDVPDVDVETYFKSVKSEVSAKTHA